MRALECTLIVLCLLSAQTLPVKAASNTIDTEVGPLGHPYKQGDLALMGDHYRLVWTEEVNGVWKVLSTKVSLQGGVLEDSSGVDKFGPYTVLTDNTINDAILPRLIRDGIGFALGWVEVEDESSPWARLHISRYDAQANFLGDTLITTKLDNHQFQYPYTFIWNWEKSHYAVVWAENLPRTSKCYLQKKLLFMKLTSNGEPIYYKDSQGLHKHTIIYPFDFKSYLNPSLVATEYGYGLAFETTNTNAYTNPAVPVKEKVAFTRLSLETGILMGATTELPTDDSKAYHPSLVWMGAGTSRSSPGGFALAYQHVYKDLGGWDHTTIEIAHFDSNWEYVKMVTAADGNHWVERPSLSTVGNLLAISWYDDYDKQIFFRTLEKDLMDPSNYISLSDPYYRGQGPYSSVGFCSRTLGARYAVTWGRKSPYSSDVFLGSVMLTQVSIS